MAIYFSSKNFKVTIIYSDADYDNNGVYIYGNPDYLRALRARVLKEKPNLAFLKHECITAFNDKKGCCLFLEMAESLDGKSPTDFKDELTEAVKYFKNIVSSEYITERFEYTAEDQSGVMNIFFSEKSSTFMVTVDNWKHLDFKIKRRYLGAFLDVMSSVAGLKIVGCGSVNKNAYEFIITSEGFGWLFKGTPQPGLLDSIFEKYTEVFAAFTDEDANKYKISEQLIKKINWLGSTDSFRW